jgi:trigger factor
MTMKVSIEDISPVKKKLNIELTSDAVDRELAKAIADVAKKAKIPGFRPGKAPKNVVEKHYSDDIRSEVMQRLVSDSYLQALNENGLIAVELPKIGGVSPLSKGTPLSFTATVEVRPKIDLGVYEGIEVKDLPVAVSDEEVTKTIDRLREMYANLEVVEGQPLAADHTAIIDFEGFCEGKPIEGAKVRDHMLILGTGNLVPGFEEQLIGMTAGETREIAVTLPQDYPAKDIAGKDARFTVTLKEIKRKVLPELNDEFAKDIGDHKNLDELKARIREDLEVRKKNERHEAQQEDLLGRLINAHTFDVPEGMVEKELMSMARQQASRMARQGMDLKKFDIAQFRLVNREMATKRVKGYLLLDMIADKEGIEVTDAEVNNALAAAARTSGQKLADVRKYYDSLDGGLDNLRLSLIHEKTLAYLLSKAKKV